MQKISSIHQFNLNMQHILGSCELKGHAYPKITEATFNFPELCKKSLYSNWSFLKYIQF